MSQTDKQRAKSEKEIVSAVGAVLFATDDPATVKDIASALQEPVETIERAIQSLGELYDRHDTGVAVERVAGGVRLATRSSVGPWVRRFFQQRNRSRLSLPALETLAIIAYRQPITSPEIQAIRGKDPSAALKGLLDKNLARILGRKKVVGNPLMYGTTNDFLMHFGLDALGDLPPIEEFDPFLDALQNNALLAGLEGDTGEPPESAETAAPVAGPGVAEDA